MRPMLTTLVLAATCWATAAEAGTVAGFGDILVWAGSGTNQAGLVLDFGTAAPQGPPAAVAWGYRWNGTASLDDMVFALTGAISGSNVPAPVAGSDPRLGIDATYYTSFQSYFIQSMTYDQVGLPAGWSQVVRALVNDFDNDLGIAQYEKPAAGGVWPAGGVLDQSPLGIADTSLTTGGWYGYVVAPYDPQTFAFPLTSTFSQPVAAVPEPTTATLAAVAVAAGSCLRRRRRRRATLGIVGRLPSPARYPS